MSGKCYHYCRERKTVIVGGRAVQMKNKFIALTDINNGIEIDDIQSMIRLLLYSDCIDIRGLIACTSCFVKKCGVKNENIIHRLISAYGKVRDNLVVHSPTYPSEDYLHSITAHGIPTFGATAGKDFATEIFNDNPGVQRIVCELLKNDDGSLYFGLWGGGNTLAQALWYLETTQKPETFQNIIGKVVIYGISDQDYACKWIRYKYADRLTYIVTPSNFTSKGSKEYYKATWPGISADYAGHGSEDGITRSKGFQGADFSYFNRKWIKNNIRNKGALGKLYPYPRFISEGDTPSFLGVIPNNLNAPDHMEYGGWGGRYVLQQVNGEPFPIYSNARDTVMGTDGKLHTSPQATIWRWREDFQNDFANRMRWCVHDSFDKCKHPPIIDKYNMSISAKRNEPVSLSFHATSPDHDKIIYEWFHYPEAGGNDFSIELTTNESEASFSAPDKECTVHIIAKVYGDYLNPFVSYVRFVVNIS